MVSKFDCPLLLNTLCATIRRARNHKASEPLTSSFCQFASLSFSVEKSVKDVRSQFRVQIAVVPLATHLHGHSFLT